MKQISILNQVMGPIIRGPSSSHTAGPLHLGLLARGLLARGPETGRPAAARLSFDPKGSFGRVYKEQGSDKGFAAGLMGWSIIDPRFSEALDLAGSEGMEIYFRLEPLAGFGPAADHPNAVRMVFRGEDGQRLELLGRSVGGGAVEIVRLDGWPVRLKGESHAVLVLAEPWVADKVIDLVRADGLGLEEPLVQKRDGRVMVQLSRSQDLSPRARQSLLDRVGVLRVWTAPPVFLVQKGRPLFDSAALALALGREKGLSLGRLALAHESRLLGLEEAEILAEMGRRLEVMRNSVRSGLAGEGGPLGLLEPSAGKIMEAEAAGRLAVGGLQTRAGARAMAVMHENGRSGLVCATPTGGSAGVIPGTVVSLVEDLGLEEEGALLALMAAGAVGMIIAARATFAAEVAGCQVEIGAAQAMAAAAVVEAFGFRTGRALVEEPLQAAAIGLQNALGSVCDPVQGRVEIPCHTRNAAAAGSAFLLADLVLGGYFNPIPLDETIDAAAQVGKLLPPALKCTALGGLALCPSAQALPRLDRG